MAQPFVGEIRLFAGNFAPAGWLMCNGQSLPISENETLFTVIGTTYGGDGEETFNLPNLQSRVPIHMGQGPSGVTYQIGEMAGTEAVTLTVQQMPTHSHAPLAANTGGSDDPTGNNWASTSTGKPYGTPPGSDAMNPGTITAAGGSQPHDNMIPYLVVTYIIALYGLFPTQ